MIEIIAGQELIPVKELILTGFDTSNWLKRLKHKSKLTREQKLELHLKYLKHRRERLAEAKANHKKNLARDKAYAKYRATHS